MSWAAERERERRANPNFTDRSGDGLVEIEIVALFYSDGGLMDYRWALAA
jgi:hypothetical protein